MRRPGTIANLIAILMAPVFVCLGQPTVAPSPEPVGRSRGENLGNYNIVNRWEVGYRAHTVNGNVGKYRSDVNFGNGVRLLSSNLGIFSRDGMGRLFDELVLTTQGLGNDPYQLASLRIQKNKLFQYDMLWRLNTYFNPGLTIAGGQHAMDTARRWQDHDFTLLPQSPIKLLLGYSRNFQDGPALTTFNLGGALGEEFPLFADVRRERNEYRLGGELNFAGFKLTVVRGWENFKEDTRTVLPSPLDGNNPDDTIALNSFRRDEPYHGNNPNWRVHLFTERGGRFSAAGRFSYVGGERSFIVDEVFNASQFGSAQNQQTVVFGTGRRPVATGNLTLTFLPTPRLSFANHTAIYNVRTEGDSAFRAFNNSTHSFDEAYFQSLGIRTLVNVTDADYAVASWFHVHGGYRYSTRRIRSRELFDFGSGEEIVDATQNNRVDAGLTGIRLQPVKGLTVGIQGEIGRADRPFFPTSERNYHALGARVVYQTGNLRLSGVANANYNTNSVSMTAHTARSRNYSFDGSWTPSSWFSIDAGYTKLHLDSLSGIAFFAARFQLVEGERSIYISNIHSGHLGARFALFDRANLYLGYTRVQDTGDGRAAPTPLPSGGLPPAFVAAQTFPLAYQSPLARLSVQLHERLRWNFGYQFYHYREDFLTLQNYRAHTGYASVVWSF